jgi:hypothetical protein
MQIRLPGTLQAGLSGGRGLAYDSVAYAARPGTFRVIDASAIVALLGVPVKAGQETVVPVAVDRLPPNANVERITATLTVVDGSAEKVTPVSVKENGGAPRTFSVSVDAAPGLRNVALRLQGGPPIWTHGGAVPAGAYQIPDFSAQANAYLDRAQINGAVVLQFVLTSETDGRVTLAVDADLQFSLLQSQSWKNPMDGTVRVDRNLQVDFNSV